MKVVINRGPGGFSLSAEATLRMRELGLDIIGGRPISSKEWYDPILNDWYSAWAPGVFNPYIVSLIRNDPILVQVVDELKHAASGSHSLLCIVEIPDGIDWEIQRIGSRGEQIRLK